MATDDLTDKIHYMNQTHRQTGQTNALASQEIRGLMGVQRKKHTGLQQVLGLSRNSAWRRMNGVIPFNTNELDAVAAWLQVPVSRLISPK